MIQLSIAVVLNGLTTYLLGLQLKRWYKLQKEVHATQLQLINAFEIEFKALHERIDRVMI